MMNYPGCQIRDGCLQCSVLPLDKPGRTVRERECITGFHVPSRVARVWRNTSRVNQKTPLAVGSDLTRFARAYI